MNSASESKPSNLHAKNGREPAVLLAALIFALLLGALALGLHRREHRAALFGGQSPAGTTNGLEQDALSVSSGVRDNDAGKQQDANGAKPGAKAVSNNEGKEMQAAQQQQFAAAQQAELDEKRRELEQQAAAQQAQEQQLEQERLRVEAENQRANAAAAQAEQQRAAAAAEAERLRQQPAQNTPRPVTYSGPSSGSIVWQGEVEGTTLVTIDGATSDTGQIVSGALPGVLVMVQPADAKHVGIAGAPAPSNSFRRLTLRIQGKGVMQEVIHWSIP